MKAKFFWIALFSICGCAISAQTSDYTSYLSKARECITSGNCEAAQRNYNVYKDLSGKVDYKLEEAIRDCKNSKSSSLAEYVDLGLPSGTQWKIVNEGSLMTYEEAVNRYGNKMPSKDQFEELLTYCEQSWTGSAMKVTGPNGKFIVFPADGRFDCSGQYRNDNNIDYWSRTRFSDGTAYGIFFKGSTYTINGNTMSSIGGCRGNAEKCYKFAVRLVR